MPRSSAACRKDYARQRQRFIIALLLTVPAAILAMAGHLLPVLRKTFEFPQRVRDGVGEAGEEVVEKGMLLCRDCPKRT